MENRLDARRKCLPVDVRDDDGIFSRGYVQDMLDNGDLEVHFDCARNPLRNISASRVFEIYQPDLPDSRISLFTDVPDPKKRPRIFGILVRHHPDDPERWYPAIVGDKSCSLFELILVKFTDSDSWLTYLAAHEVNRVRLVETDRKQARFRKYRRWGLSVLERDFDLDGTPLDGSQKQQCLVVGEGNPFSAMLFNSLSKYETGMGLSERCVGVRERTALTVNVLRRKVEKILDVRREVDASVHQALYLPEILGRIGYFMESAERRRLERICRFWYHVLKMREVRRLARYSIADSEEWFFRQHCGRRREFVRDFFYCFTQYLKVLIIQDVPTDDGRIWTLACVIRNLLVDISVLPNALETVVFIDGRLDHECLATLLSAHPHLAVVLRNSTVWKIRMPGMDDSVFAYLPLHIHSARLKLPDVVRSQGEKPDPEYVWSFVLDALADHLDSRPADAVDLERIQKAVALKPQPEVECCTVRNPALILKRLDPGYYQPEGKDLSYLQVSALRPSTLRFLRHALRQKDN